MARNFRTKLPPSNPRSACKDNHHPMSMPMRWSSRAIRWFADMQKSSPRILVSYLDTARRPVSFLAKKARFVTTSNVRSCHKARSSANRSSTPESVRASAPGLGAGRIVLVRVPVRYEVAHMRQVGSWSVSSLLIYVFMCASALSTLRQSCS